MSINSTTTPITTATVNSTATTDSPRVDSPSFSESEASSSSTLSNITEGSSLFLPLHPSTNKNEYIEQPVERYQEQHQPNYYHNVVTDESHASLQHYPPSSSSQSNININHSSTTTATTTYMHLNQSTLPQYYPPQQQHVQQQHHMHHPTIIEMSNIPNMIDSSPILLKQCKSSSSLNSNTSSSEATTISSSQTNNNEKVTTFITFNPQNAQTYKPKRTNKACTACKSAHKKCSNTRPCTRCISLNREDKCVDMDSGRKRGRRANMPRSGGLLVHNYDPHNPFVSGKPNTVVFSLQHAINEDPGSNQKPPKKVKQTPSLPNTDDIPYNPHQSATTNAPIIYDTPHATYVPNHSNIYIPHPTPLHHIEHASIPPFHHHIEHASHPTSSTITTQKTLPSISELTECKNILSNSQSVFYQQ